MTIITDEHYDRQYHTHLKHLKLKGLQPKTIVAYARAIRRLGGYFSNRIDDLSETQLTDYFSDLIESHSWSAVKLDLYGLKFYTTHVLHKPWVMPHLIKPPETQRLPDIVTVDEAQRLFSVLPGHRGPLRKRQLDRHQQPALRPMGCDLRPGCHADRRTA